MLIMLKISEESEMDGGPKAPTTFPGFPQRPRDGRSTRWRGFWEWVVLRPVEGVPMRKSGDAAAAVEFEMVEAELGHG